MVKILKVNIDDLIPSARQLRGTVRSVLWGIVEAVVESKNEDLIEMASEQEIAVRIDFRQEEKKGIERMNEVVDGEVEDEGDYLIQADEVSKSQMREQILAIQMEYDQLDYKDNQQDEDNKEVVLKNDQISIDISDFELPLSFGSSSHARKKSKKSKGGKKKKNQNKTLVLENIDSYYRNSAGCPSNFVWNKELRLPDEVYMEYNVYMIDITDYNNVDKKIKNIIENKKAIFENPESEYYDTNTKRYPVRVLGSGTYANQQISYVQLLGYPENLSFEITRNFLLPTEKHENEFVICMLDYQLFDILDQPTGVHKDVHNKYWDQRYRLFSLFDRGVDMDSESW
eukprot:CAMPEP_0119034632 /NCGR_PEP_ID=MMETSP1177-20130426/1632_1 /TAXON_ID=2985 /ORGANISM="Ochromonas sp, Strain CCMP1899" /LENGTH=341 /DNA_ID=CAMNT_0006992203 /DNA_START=182 /DNA_END=1204 /DNA_ORIENTATION=+